jgi:hypothetical protein
MQKINAPSILQKPPRHIEWWGPRILKHILRYLARVKHLRLTWCASATFKKGFELFQIYTFADTSWADDKNFCKSTCCYSCKMLSFLVVASCLRLLQSLTGFRRRTSLDLQRCLCTSLGDSILSEISCGARVWAICTYTVVRRQYGH